MEHKLVSTYSEPINPYVAYVCSCLQEGNREWFEKHLVQEGAVEKGMFLRYHGSSKRPDSRTT